MICFPLNFLFFLFLSIVDLKCFVIYCCRAKWFSYYICILFCILFSIMVSHKLLNMVPYTVGPCCLSTLYIEEWICCLSTLDKVEWICCSQIPNLLSPPFAFRNHKVTSLHTLPSSKRSAKGWAGGKKSPGEARERSRGRRGCGVQECDFQNKKSSPACRKDLWRGKGPLKDCPTQPAPAALRRETL